MNLFVLGAGYIGLAFIQEAKKRGWTITTTSRDPQKVEELKSIVDKSFLWKKKIVGSFDAILFLAGKDRAGSYQETYLENARLLNHPRVIYTSSTSLYGDHAGKVVEERTPLKPTSEEQRILIETEKTILEQSKGALIFRLGESIGLGRDVETKMARCKIQSLPSSGENFTNIIHRDDVVAALLFGIENNLQGIYNLVSDLHIPRREWYRRHGVEVTWDPTKRSVHSGNKIVSNEKIKSAGFSFLQLQS